MKNTHISAVAPAANWADGHPLGNGTIGAVVLGRPDVERISLNHGLLWRQFSKYHPSGVGKIIPELQRLGLGGDWEAAHDLLLTKVPESGKCIYNSPYVPLGDLLLSLNHTTYEPHSYLRKLNLSTGISHVSYINDGVEYRRETFVSWPDNVLVIRLSTSVAGRLTGKIGFSRLPDPDCNVETSAGWERLAMEGIFEEGVRFAASARVANRGGRLTLGTRSAQCETFPKIGKDLKGAEFIFRDESSSDTIENTSFLCFDSCTEVTITISMEVGGFDDNPLEKSRRTIDACSSRPYEDLRKRSADSHAELFERCELDLRVGEHIPISDLTGQESLAGREQAALVSQLFDFGRYLAICSGRPHSSDANQNSPINLQGIWCQDRRPPWDSDLHLDLNIQMCYWPLPMVGLSDLLPLVADWMQRLLPQAKVAARDQFDALGAVWPITCDLNNLGNMEDLCMPWAGGGAWLVQVLWTGWEYTQDLSYLRERVYPLLLETALFYQSYAFVNDAGYIDLPISMSPEMGVKGRSRYSALTGIATVDIELMRATFEALLKAGKVLDSDQDKWGEWEDFISKLPKLPILASGLVGEWVYPHEEIDPYHRHRTPLIGLAPGDRITNRTTPEELEACRRYLNFRRSDLKSSCAWSNVWDAQFLARLGQGDEALEVFGYIAKRWLLEGGFLACLDWRETSGTLNWFPGQKLVQIEASIGMVASVCDLFIQDRQGIIEFLPALPTAFPEGSLSGVCLRGGFEADFTWKSGLLSKVTIRSKKGGDCRVDVTGRAAQLQVTSGHQVNIESGLMTALVSPDMPLELNAISTP